MTILIAIITALLGWVGFSITAVLKGWMIPAKTHEREIASYVSQIARQDAEIVAWRGVATVEQSSNVELLGQHRLTIEGVRSINYSIDQMRSGLERASKEATPGER